MNKWIILRQYKINYDKILIDLTNFTSITRVIKIHRTVYYKRERKKEMLVANQLTYTTYRNTRRDSSMLRARVGRLINLQIGHSEESECIVHRIVQDVAQEIAHVSICMYMCVCVVGARLESGLSNHRYVCRSTLWEFVYADISPIFPLSEIRRRSLTHTETHVAVRIG